MLRASSKIRLNSLLVVVERGERRRGPKGKDCNASYAVEPELNEDLSECTGICPSVCRVLVTMMQRSPGLAKGSGDRATMTSSPH